MQWRDGDTVFWHGSAASRFLERVDGAPVCLTCTIMDGYVLGRSIFNHSVNYRSAMVFGTARLVRDDAARLGALRALADALFPGRWDTLRPVTAQELKATSVVRLDIEEASAKTRTGPPGDTEDAAWPVWAGVLPIETAFLPPKASPDLMPGLAFPDALGASGGLGSHIGRP